MNKFVLRVGLFYGDGIASV